MSRLRVVLDTNVLVSGAAYPASFPGKIVDAWIQGNLVVILSNFILEEFERVFPKLKRNFRTFENIHALVSFFKIRAEMVDLELFFFSEPRLRDPLDQPILHILIASGAQYLVTGDKDLLVLANHYNIISPANFWSQYGDQPKLAIS